MPTAALKYDYPALKLQFLDANPPISIDELCRRNGIPESRATSIARKAREEGWVELRDKRLTLTDQQVVEQLAERSARRQLRRMQVEDNAIDAIDEAIYKLRADMKRTKLEKNPETGEYDEVPVVTYRPEQVVQLMDRIKELFGGLPAAPENPGGQNLTQINFGSFDGNDPAHRALAAEVIAATRPVGGATRGRASASPLPDAPGAGAD